MTGDIYNGAQSSSGLRVIVVALLPIVVLAVVIVALFFSWRVCRGRIRGESSSSSASIESKDAPLLPPRASPTPSIDAETILKHIQLLEIIAVRHSGGCVRKAKLENEVRSLFVDCMSFGASADDLSICAKLHDQLIE